MLSRIVGDVIVVVVGTVFIWVGWGCWGFDKGGIDEALTHGGHTNLKNGDNSTSF